MMAEQNKFHVGNGDDGKHRGAEGVSLARLAPQRNLGDGMIAVERKHDCWFINALCIFCKRPQREGENPPASYCRVAWADGALTGYVCPNICGACRTSRRVKSDD
jgi:hypothetical protein